MINIFGKLYTLLRRPQRQNEAPENSGQQEAEGTSDTNSPSQQNGEKITQSEHPNSRLEEADFEKVPADYAANLSGTDVDRIQVETIESKEVEDSKSNQVSGNETMDMEAMAKLVAEMQEESTSKDDTGNAVSSTNTDQETTDQLATETHDKDEETKLSLATQDRDVEQVVKKDEESDEIKAKDGVEAKKKQKEDKDETKEKKGKRQNKKACYYFKKGLQCYKGKKCAFSHDRDCETPSEKAEEKKVFIREEDFNSYKDFVGVMTMNGNSINPKDLLYKLGYEKLNMETMGSILVGQYKLASSRNRWQWVSQARYYAELFFPNSWIDENLPSRDGRKLARTDKPRQKKSKYNVNENFEGRRTMCQDVRLLDNPNLTVISSNFGNKKKETTPQDMNIDEFVTEYTNGIINEAVRIAVEGGKDTDTLIRGAMREAIDEGLSESMIMEVINDVTKVGGTPMSVRTPDKRGKVNKPDTKRTPRKRPDELAVGFNYLADELVKHSPKTVDGGIICMDILPPSRERPEQLAFGFNFHADKLVKESPVTEKGDVLIPGVVLTPGRKARDQLAMGFNYHSDMVVKESPKSTKQDDRPVNKGRRKKLYNATTSIDENTPYVETVDQTGDARHKTRNTQEDKFAIGFSKNAELIAHADDMVMKVLGEKDMNMVNEHSSNIDTEFDEERNYLESEDSFIPTMAPSRLPAGSVW